jgi:hypothetical protein
MFTHVSAGGSYPISMPGGDWRSLVMEMVLTAILVSVILNTATGGRSIGHNAAIAVGATVTLLGLFASPISGASMNPARTLGPDVVGNDYTRWWTPRRSTPERPAEHRRARLGHCRGHRPRSAGTCELASRCLQRAAGASRPAGLRIVSG